LRGRGYPAAHCPRWEVGRTILAERLDCELTPENLVEEMLRSDERCKMVVKLPRENHDDEAKG
jgi:hypothetical protein